MSVRFAVVLLAGCSTLDIPPAANIADGDTGVEPVKVIRIPLDPATPASAVSGDAFTLADDQGFVLPVDAVLQTESMTVELTPIRPMATETVYSLASSLADVDGEPIELSFTTLENPIFRQFDFFPGSVEPMRYTETDDQGRDLHFEDPGPDGIWPSPDDVPSSYTVVQDRVGDTQLTVTFGAGPDGDVFTSDDEPLSYRKSLFEGPLRVRQLSFSTGNDRQLETADDVLSQIRAESRNEVGQLTKLVIAIDGGDNMPDSGDDLVVFVGVVFYDARGLLERFVTVEAGPDGMLDTADDVVPDGPPTSLYDERGVYLGTLGATDRSTNFVDSRGVSYREDFFQAGLDGAVNTPDDTIFFRLEYRVP